MANADKKHMGAGSQGKGDDSGARTIADIEEIGENQTLSNRDKSQHSRTRGLDSKRVETDQLQDHHSNKIANDRD